MAILASGAVASVSPDCARALFDIDFAASTHRVDATGEGSFHGVLPPGMGENFSSWSAGHVESELKDEDGRRFLRLVTKPGEAGGQFAIVGFEPDFPGVFRLRVTARTAGSAPLRFGLRLQGAPYTEFSSASFVSSVWKERTYVFSVDRKRTGPAGMFVYTGAGTADLARMTLEPATEADLTEAVPRPPKTLTDFIRHARFPLGLPGGWNLGRDCLDAVCSADAEEPAPDGEPVLKVSAEHPWTLFGEAFQTAHPGQPHTLVFSYRSAVPVQVSVVDENGSGVAGTSVPGAADWRTERLVFRPTTRAKAFGLRFSGDRGPFRLDRVRVHLGVGDPPPPPYGCQVALAVKGGEIADETHIQFTDEEPLLELRALGLPKDARVVVKAADLYGREKTLSDGYAADEAQRGVIFANRAFEDRPVGQFRVTAWAEQGDRRISEVDELVVTRLPRPVAWGRDAPESPFGCHFNPNRAVVATMKAAGVNWVRLHDAGSQVSGWYAQEAEKGKWTFHDEEVACYRGRHVKIFAQLGTAPAWATHYGDLGCRSMGYFEKYLRPTNRVDWVNYVTNFVKRYERDIDEYFVWNEPWGRWWKSAADMKYFDEARAGFDFGEFCRLTYDAVKKVNPGIRVSGFNSFWGKSGGEWSADVLAGGGFEACDIIDWHYYTPNPRALRGDGSVTEGPIAPIRARHPDLGGKPVYMSEGQGTCSGSAGETGPKSGLLKASVPWPEEGAAEYTRVADQTVRYVISLLAEGNAKVFLYTAHSYDGLSRTPLFIVLLGADSFAHPALVAHAQLAQAVEGRRFLRKEPFGRNGMRYVFEGRGRTVAAYTELAEDEMLALAEKTALVDLYGNPVRPGTCVPFTVVYAGVSRFFTD